MLKKNKVSFKSVKDEVIHPCFECVLNMNAPLEHKEIC